jgi:hypothetical protein
LTALADPTRRAIFERLPRVRVERQMLHPPEKIWRALLLIEQRSRPTPHDDRSCVALAGLLG